MAEDVPHEVSEELGLGLTMAESGETALPASLPEALWEDRRSDSFEQLYAGLTARQGNLANAYLFHHVAELLLRWRRIPWGSPKGLAVVFAVPAAVYLAVPFFLTAAVGDWTGVPVWRWVVVAIVCAMTYVPGATVGPTIAEMLTLNRTLVNESDLRRVVAFSRRWHRVRVTVVVAVVYAAVVLLIARLLADTGLGEFPIGSAALLVLILYEAGELANGSITMLGLLRIESKFPHRLYWPSPVDSLALRITLRGLARMDLIRGVIVTVYIVFMMVLLSFDSPLLVPVVIALVAIHYFTIIASVVVTRASVRRIVQQAKEGHTRELKRRITSLAADPYDLTETSYDEFERLNRLHNLIRDAANGPRTARVAGRAVSALIVPTIGLLITVIGEQYTGRFFEKILP